MSTKIKLIFIDNNTEIGGAQLHILDMIKSINKDIFEPKVILPVKEGAYHKAIQQQGFAEIIPYNFGIIANLIKAHPFRPIYSPFAKLRLIKLLKKINPDIIHANGVATAKNTISAAKSLQIPFVVNIQNVFHNHKYGLNKYVDRNLYKNSSKIVCNSSAMKNIFINRTNAKNVTMIYNGTFLDQYLSIDSSDKLEKEKYNIPENKRILTVVAKLSSQKGHHVLIESMPEIMKNIPDCHFVFLGDEYEGTGVKDFLLTCAKENNVQDCITWIDFIEDVSPILKLSYATVLPSVAGEGLPRSICESMISGTPVISSNIAGTPEQVEDGVTGYLTTINDKNSLSKAIIKLMQLSDEEYQAMCLQNKNKGKEMFDMEKVIHEYENLYKSILKK